MATTAQQTLLQPLGGYAMNIPHQVDSSGSYDINQGDLCYFDTAAYMAKPLDSDAHAAYLIGVAAQTSWINPYGTKHYFPQIGFLFRAVFSFNTTTGDTYHDGDTLYLGADAQTVTNTAGGSTHAVGYVSLIGAAPVIGTAYTVAGGSGVTITALVLSQFPVAL